MVLPPLSEFIHPAPVSLVSFDPAHWLEDCLAGGGEYLVLTDDQQLPVRVLPLSYLLSLANACKPTASAVQDSPGAGGKAVAKEAGAAVSFPEYFPLEMGVLATTTSTEVAAQRVATAPDTCWVLVDTQQRYCGLLDKSRLLAVALSQVSTLMPLEPSGDAQTVERVASQSNTALLTYLGHELKTPLTSLLGLSSLLRTGSLGELNPRQTRYIGLIQQHCRRLAVWVNTLIDLGRIDSGALRLIPRIVDLPTLWQDAYRQAALRLGQEDSPSPLPPVLATAAADLSLVADPSRLQQMLSCLIQTALALQTASPEIPELPLRLEQWGNWIAFMVEALDDSLGLDQISQMGLTLPFPATPAPTTPLSAEMGHWLEWLLVRKLAQLHRGELVVVAHPNYGVCPTLLLPATPAPIAARESRFLLVVSPVHPELVQTLQQQATQLNYRLLMTHHIKDAIEIAGHLPLSAILVLVQGHQSIHDLQDLKAHLGASESLVIALVPPQWSSLLGELPADRELLWPSASLGSVLLQPPPLVPAPNRLTILYLKAPTLRGPTRQGPAATQQFPHIFHDFGCRVLEVDDIEQAALLRRVWKPQVGVLDPAIAVPSQYLQTLSTSPELTSLPLITLTLAATQAAHNIPALSVFPCLVGETAWETPEASDRMTTWLIQVLQVAATQSKQG